jgi:hypothetical protein
MIRRPAGGFPPILLGAPLLGCALLAACGRNDAPEANQSGPVKIEGQPIRIADEASLSGTPMAERSAVIGLLN